MLLIIKDRFSEPTMLMKINYLTAITHDVNENTWFRMSRTSTQPSIIDLTTAA